MKTVTEMFLQVQHELYRVRTGVKVLLSVSLLLPIWALLMLNSAIDDAAKNHNTYVELIRHGVSDGPDQALAFVHLGSANIHNVEYLASIRQPLVLSIMFGLFIVAASWVPTRRTTNDVLQPETK